MAKRPPPRAVCPNSLGSCSRRLLPQPSRPFSPPPSGPAAYVYLHRSWNPGGHLPAHPIARDHLPPRLYKQGSGFFFPSSLFGGRGQTNEEKKQRTHRTATPKTIKLSTSRRSSSSASSLATTAAVPTEVKGTHHDRAANTASSIATAKTRPAHGALHVSPVRARLSTQKSRESLSPPATRRLPSPPPPPPVPPLPGRAALEFSEWGLSAKERSQKPSGVRAGRPFSSVYLCLLRKKKKKKKEGMEWHRTQEQQAVEANLKKRCRECFTR